MSTEQNKSIVRRYLEEAWGKGNAGVLQQLVGRDVCDHNPAPGQPRGLEGQLWILETLRRAVPDMTMTVENLVAEGDLVIDHWTSTGTNKGEMFGQPPTGKRFTITGSDMCRLENGKIEEFWHVEDNLSMMQQLGQAPASPQISRSSGARTGTGSYGGGQRRTLTPDEKRTKIRRAYQEFIDRRNLNDVDQYLTEDYVGHFSAAPTVHGRQEFRDFLSIYLTAFSNLRAQVDDIIVEGEMAGCRVVFTGTQTGKLMDFPASGKPVKVYSLSLFRFDGDRVAEQWANNDDLGQLQQIGVIPRMAEVEMAGPC